MNNDILADRFKQGATQGKGSHMFIEDKTIYSYGYHFKICERFKEGVYLFNLNGYSVSTSAHKSHVRNALSCDTLIYLKDCSINKAEDTLKYNDEEILTLKDKSTRARKEHIKNMYLNAIKDLEIQNDLIRNEVLK